MASYARSLFQSTFTLYDTLSSYYRDHYDVYDPRAIVDFERGRFWAWGEVMGLTRNAPAPRGIEHQPDIQIENSYERLKCIKEGLETAIDDNYRSGRTPTNGTCKSDFSLHLCLQEWNDQLQDLLPPLCRSSMNELWPRRTALPQSFHTPPVTKISIGDPQRTPQRLRPTAAMKYMGQLQKRTGSDDLFVNKAVDIDSEFGEHSLGWYQPDNGTARTPILVEWKVYDSRWTSTTGEELYNRVGEIAKLLHSPERHGRQWLRVLNCTGWLHDQQECRFGFVYDISETPVSLNSLIVSPKKEKPPLGMKFQLAAMLARCLRDVHDIGWIHKNISAYNIVFSPSEGAMKFTVSPYLIAFHQSRIDNEKEFTEGPNISNKHIEYQHPEYSVSDKSEQSRFHRIYDYYSLGIVLLEIGFWSPLSKIIEKQSTLSPAELRNYFIKYAPRLDPFVGALYREAVVVCLKGEFGDLCRVDSDLSRRQTQAEFESKVVKPLTSCLA